MNKLFDLGAYVSIALAIIGIVASVFSFLLTKEKEHRLNANTPSGDSLREQLGDGLTSAKRRYYLNQIAHYSLSIISIIGGILISTVYFHQMFPKQIGIMGFLILISSLLRLFFRPLERSQRAKRDLVFLKKLERDYNQRCIDDPSKATSFLTKKLNEYDDLSLSD